MKDMPPECEIGKELDHQKCLACKDKCDLGKRQMEIFKRYQNDKWWYKHMRQEIDDVLDAR
jgi:hypothetical protein